MGDQSLIHPINITVFTTKVIDVVERMLNEKLKNIVEGEAANIT